MLSNFRFILFLLVAITTLTSITAQFCQEDYSPCLCYDWPEGIYVACYNIPLDDVHNVFRNENHTTRSYFRVRLNLNKTDDMVPSDLFGDRTTSQLEIYCPDRYQLQVDQNAFGSSKEQLTSVEISHCNLEKLDMAFVGGCDNLDTLSITESSQLETGLSSLPSLPSLTSLTINDCTGLNEWTKFPVLANGLNIFHVFGNQDLGDDGADRILEWIEKSSASTLESLQMNSNALSKIPERLSAFRELAHLSLQNNIIPEIPTGSLSFSAPVKSLYVYADQVKAIQPEALSGDFSQAVAISLMGNNLTHFDASVFRPVLEQLRQSASTTKVNVDQNPFDCESDPCHLAWIIRDDPGLLDYVAEARCSNGIWFADLKPSGFENCANPVTSTTVKTTVSTQTTTSTTAGASLPNNLALWPTVVFGIAIIWL